MVEAQLAGVTKRFDDGTVVAVDDLGLEIRDGEFLVLVGPSGCGKSTTLRLIAGLERITEGEVRIGGEVMNDVKPKDRDIAMVFQNYALYPQKTVQGNMEFGLKISTALGEAKIEERVARAAEMLDITELLDRRPKALSGGQKQRVALGRAIVRDPGVFLMDEPLSNLDAKLRAEMRTELQQLHRELETTTVYVTHDQTEAMTMADRIVVLNDGQLQQVGTPLECYYEPANEFVAEFIGSPSMNLLSGRFVDGAIRFGTFEYPLPDEQSRRVREGLTGEHATLGIRPEDVELVEEAGPRTVEASIQVTEPMGKENVLHLDVDGHEVVAVISGELVVGAGGTLRIRFPPDRIHVFDERTGEALLNRERSTETPDGLLDRSPDRGWSDD